MTNADTTCTIVMRDLCVEVFCMKRQSSSRDLRNYLPYFPAINDGSMEEYKITRNLTSEGIQSIRDCQHEKSSDLKWWNLNFDQ